MVLSNRERQPQSLPIQGCGRTPFDLHHSAGANIGAVNQNYIQEVIGRMVQEAKGNGMSTLGLKQMETMLQEHIDVFRANLGADPPAKVEPMRIKLRENHRPVRAKQRNYPPRPHEFIAAAVR